MSVLMILMSVITTAITCTIGSYYCTLRLDTDDTDAGA